MKTHVKISQQQGDENDGISAAMQRAHPQGSDLALLRLLRRQCLSSRDFTDRSEKHAPQRYVVVITGMTR